MNILIVEDDPILADSLKDLLTNNKYHVDVVHDGADALEYAKSDLYSLMILDVMLPSHSGFEIVKTLRNSNIKIPVIMLTAKSHLEDRVKGLDCGADDYLTKPFYPDELLARLRALLRRPDDIQTNTLKFNDLKLNLNNCKLNCNDGEIQLSTKEFKLLHMLISYKGTIVSKEFIIQKVWGLSSEIEENNVEAYISFLRKKLAFLESSVSIKTKRNMGYYLEVPPC